MACLVIPSYYVSFSRTTDYPLDSGHVFKSNIRSPIDEVVNRRFDSCRGHAKVHFIRALGELRRVVDLGVLGQGLPGMAYDLTTYSKRLLWKIRCGMQRESQINAWFERKRTKGETANREPACLLGNRDSQFTLAVRPLLKRSLERDSDGVSCVYPTTNRDDSGKCKRTPCDGAKNHPSPANPQGLLISRITSHSRCRGSHFFRHLVSPR